MASYKRDIDFFYYTPINTKINPQIFKDYSDNVSKEPISEKIADLMSNVENMIVSSNAFKMQENRPTINHMKWQIYKVKKIPLTSLFMILNKINNDNIDNVIEETLQYKIFTQSEIVQIADVFLGKCIMETKNVSNYIKYLKSIMENKLWYVYDGEKRVVSFRDTIIDRLENEYNRLTRIAGHIEDVFKNQIKDDTMMNKLEGSEDYLKKKNIILSLIKLIGSFYNGKIISTSLLENILDNLRHQYDDNQETRKIYLELWLNLWENVSQNLNKNYRSIYESNYDWLKSKYEELVNWTMDEDSIDTKPWDIMRLTTLIEKSLNKNDISNHQSEMYDVPANKNEELTIFNINVDEMNELFEDDNDTAFNSFKMKYNKETLNKYITKYLLENCEASILKKSISKIIKHFVTKKELEDLIQCVLNDDEIICDYPLFKKNIMQYL